jgi:protein O-GlcNAc transferase
MRSMTAPAGAAQARVRRHDPVAEGDFQRGLALARQFRWTQAAEAFGRAATQNQDEPLYWLNLADARMRLGDHERAADAARRACAMGPLSEVAVSAAAHCLAMANRHEEVVALLSRRDLARVEGPNPHFALGRSLLELQRFQEAIEAFFGALRRDPRFTAAHIYLGNTFERMRMHEEARECFLTALELGGEAGELLSAMTHQDQHACRWDLLGEDMARLAPLLARGDSQPAPFQLLTLDSTRAQQRAAAQAFHRLRCGSIAPLPALPASRRAGPIRVGYLSCDLVRHATAYLIAELFEQHDPDSVEAHAYSYGADDGSPVRARLSAALGERFHDVATLSDRAIAERIRADGIDILVDLKGYTQGARAAIAAFRPARVQVNFLGYPGTLGSDCHDFILGDPVVTPLEHADAYSEAIAQLPHCYQPNDRLRAMGPRPAREDCGLPAEGFVFCSFNSCYKITESRFGAWCRLLAAVPGSVLWLYEANAQAARNLAAAARARAIDPSRIVFAPHRDLSAHLARLQLADLVLDTFPVTAHTTASDALWAGVPLLTQLGETFVSRVAASVLAAAGVPELVTADAQAYESLALALARDPARLQALRARVCAARTASPLFDSPGYARALESLYARMLARPLPRHAASPLPADARSARAPLAMAPA